MQVNSFGFSYNSTGGHTARSMMLLEMQILIHSLPLVAERDDIANAIVDENILDKPTQASRVKSLRHLMELYSLNPSKALFRVLWELGHADGFVNLTWPLSMA